MVTFNEKKMKDKYTTTESYFDYDLNLEAELDYEQGDNLTTKISSPKKCVDDSKEWKMFQTLFLCVGSSSIIIAGTAGNVVAYCVLNQRGYKGNVVAKALRYLAFLDTLILWTALLDVFVKGAINFDISSTSYELCAIKLAYVLIVTSIGCWLLVVISATRLIYLTCPVKGPSVCSKFNYFFCLVLMHLIIVGIHSSAFFAIYLRFPKGKMNTMCYFAVTNITKGTLFIPINMGTNFIGPFCSLTVITILMYDCSQRALQSGVHRLCKSCVVETNEKDGAIVLPLQEKNGNFHKNVDFQKTDDFQRDVEDVTATSLSSKRDSNANTNHMDVHDDSTIITATSTSTNRWNRLVPRSVTDAMSERLDFDVPDDKDANTEERQAGGLAADDIANDTSQQDNSAQMYRRKTSHSIRKDSSVRSLTRVLMVANCVYFAVSLPFWIFHLFLRGLVLKHITGCYLRELIPYIVFLLQYSNHGLNFYFYCASGERFRRDLMTWLQSFRK